MDFRGRTYPCPPHFNHLGSDVTRSILLFAKGQKLGPRGLDWLKIHLINLTGFKKRSSNAERLMFANENMDNILNSADHPMEGRCWWQTSDEPWQTLACCMEIAKAVRSPDPAEYVSHFPVHQDGSCNGLQHYAALGRDQAGAESVNLSPSDQPQDVYSDVCELVECERAKDAKNGILIAQKLEGFVKRKIIKQTVMTTVYGVTRYGAKYQILKQLKDLQDFDPEYVWPACVYLADKTFLCLAEMFSATKEIQMWLTFCAHHIATLSLRPVEWITPLGLPVVQPYHKMSTFQRWGVSLSNSMSTFEKPNSLKQKNAFPPNFIHSLDSTHMLLTALYCLREGITYVSVHDCFWTHPASVEIMNKICREQFVALHNQPILEDLSKHLLKKFCTTSKGSSLQEVPNQRILQSMLGKVPKKGTFNLEQHLFSFFLLLCKLTTSCFSVNFANTKIV
ncbi:POLRMT [Acanthosepion pharaonis]|uniref:DNA-directed RNA polymerase n=1 Tax=Acanthosepion pharaonis TaxID=158019 RepID=A0A812C4W6_ACAPH|nr:POLRMT [Sepia pharaonis]